MVRIVLVAAATFLLSAQAAAIVVVWPVACELGMTCEIQNYVDADPSKDARDFMCGSRTYDAHDGTDIRLPSLKAMRLGVNVRATAAGKVLRTRSNVADVSVREAAREKIGSHACGNGVVIDHGQGWETQYCHMQRDSLTIRPGDLVSAGQAIGKIGLSGLTEYPHLHFTVRFNGQVVDPFAFEAPPESCGGGRPIWDSASQPTYKMRTILNVGFSSMPVTMQMVEAGEIPQLFSDQKDSVLVAFVRYLGLKKGDEQKLTIIGPDGRLFAEGSQPPLDSNKAQYLHFVGKGNRETPWPKGTFKAIATVSADGTLLVKREFGVRLD